MYVDAYMQLYFAGDPKWQVQDTWERAKPYNPGGLWIAVEDQTPMSPQVRINKLWAAIAACNELGIKVGGYTAKWAWLGLMGNTNEFSGLPIWVAAYDDVPELDWGSSSYYGVFGGWPEEGPTMKQWLNSQRLGGVYCDANVRVL